MLRNRGNRSVFEINSIFAPSLNCTREFWNSSTAGRERLSLILDSDNAAMEQKRITPYPLLVTTEVIMEKPNTTSSQPSSTRGKTIRGL